MIEDFAIFIMVWGDPSRDSTYKSLRKQGYTGKIYFVADNLDEALEGYKKRYGDDLLIFDKLEMAQKVDTGDNSGDLRSTLFAANAIHELAKELEIPYYGIFCDDYTGFNFKMDDRFEYTDRRIISLDDVFSVFLEFYKSIPATSIAMAQGGDYIGGRDNKIDRNLGSRRKVMNTFICSTERPFQFFGRLNEDVTTYVLLGGRGELFLTYPLISINQPPTQSHQGGLTEVYLDNGTFTKSFFTVMYSPSNVRIALMGIHFPRIHHKIIWSNAVPHIIQERYKKRDKSGTKPTR